MSSENYQELHREMFGITCPGDVARKSSAASLFSKGSGFMNSFDYTMQLQAGCVAGCLFCYVRTGFRLAPRDLQQRWGFEVRDKISVADKLARSLVRGELADKTVYSSGVSDTYSTSPWVTKQVWETLLQCPTHLRPRRLVVQTRFRACRDVELMAEYERTSSPSDNGPAVVVSYSIGTDRQDLIDAWELRTPSFAARMRTIERLRAYGLWVVPTLSPLAPWSNLTGELRRLRGLEIPYITTLFFKESEGPSRTPRPFLEHLQRCYPEVLDLRWLSLRVDEMKEVFGVSRVLIGKQGFDSLTAPQLVV